MTSPTDEDPASSPGSGPVSSTAENAIWAILAEESENLPETPTLSPTPRRWFTRFFDTTLPPRTWGGNRWAPRALVGIAVIFGFVVLRAERLPVAYPNDAAVHSLTVAFARQQIASGHFPLDGWFPFLSLGSPFFLHYQSFSAVITGLIAEIFGAPQTFAWTGYILLSIWPISVYLGARLFDLDRWSAAAAAAVAPLITNGATGYGFEHEAYIFYGSGLWSQLWGMLLLPVALGLAWRAISRRQDVVLAGFALGWVIIFHFLTAYLAGLSLIVFMILRPSQIFQRFKRTVIVGAYALLIACWILVPLIATANWAATNEFEEGTYFDNSYGAKQILTWFLHSTTTPVAGGQIFDGYHFPIITILAAVGALACLFRWRRDERARALIGIFVLSLFLYFGRVTWGSLLKVLPDNGDLLFHRYVMGVQLFGALFAGVGAVTIARTLALSGRLLPAAGRRLAETRWIRIATPVVAICLLVAVLNPAWRAISTYDHYSGQQIVLQRQADATAGVEVNALIKRAESEGGGRIYAGLPTDGWAYNFRVGSVPVYIYLADEGVDAVGFTLRTSSLTTDPEAYFNENVPNDYELFGIHYLIYPNYRQPTVPASLLETRGIYDLYAVQSFGYVHILDTSGVISANSSDLGRATSTYLEQGYADKGIYDFISYPGLATPVPTSPGTIPTTSPGTVIAENDNLDEGEVTTTVRMNRTAVVTLSASYDPGWRITVDGQPSTPEMVVPAIVGVTVGPGIHTIVFRYQSYELDPELIAVSVLTAIGGLVYERRRRRRSTTPVPPGKAVG